MHVADSITLPMGSVCGEPLADARHEVAEFEFCSLLRKEGFVMRSEMVLYLNFRVTYLTLNHCYEVSLPLNCKRFYFQFSHLCFS